MFAKFNLKLENDDYENLAHFSKLGFEMYDHQRRSIHENLNRFLSPDGILDASAIEEEWFPSISSHLFLSHSHRDKDAVISFAGFLQRNYGITSFIDSTVWGYANNLLKQIDNKYCVQSIKPSGEHTYDYDKRNQSTAHVHLILQGALAKMINRCECLIFVNTPHSVSCQDIGHEEKTSSPWIYSELLMANTFPARKPSDHGIRADSFFEHSELKVEYDVNLVGFVDLDLSDIQSAGVKSHPKTARGVLNQLYMDKGILK